MTNVRWTLVLASLALSGCGHGSPEHTLVPVEDHLVKIAQAYRDATHRLGHVPKSMAELKPYLAADAGDDVTRSPNDNEEYVILWGVDYDKLPVHGDDPFTVAAYEKSGSGGKRYVLRFPPQVILMTDEELSKAVFPPGFQPPH